MEERCGYRCDSCRWCCNGECRFFDVLKDRKVEQKTAETCPFFEDLNAARSLQAIAVRLGQINHALQALQDIREMLEECV